MIKLESVCATYGRKEVLKSVFLDIKAGSINVIVGKNGSGKSTLLKAITKQLKYTGSISINEIDLKNISNNDRSKLVSYLPQITSNANITVEKLVRHGRYPYTTYNRVLSESDNIIINEAMKKTDTLHLKSRYINQLSGGERQRAFLGMILAQDTEYVVLDEPCNFLDIDHQLSVLKIIKDLKNYNKTVIVVLHDLQQAFTVADNIIIIDNGVIIESGSVDSVASSSSIKNCFNLELEKTDEGIYSYFLKYT